VVADAVVVEPVSTPTFPANREKNREFNKIGASGAAGTVNNGVVTGLPVRIPYSAEQGIILSEHGIMAQKQGVLLGGIEIIVGWGFRYTQPACFSTIAIGR